MSAATEERGRPVPRTRLVQVAAVKKVVKRSRGRKAPPFLSSSTVYRVPNKTVSGLTALPPWPPVQRFIVPWQEIVDHTLAFYPQSYGPSYNWTMRRVLCLVYTLQQTTWDFECLVVTPMALCLVPGKNSRGHGMLPFPLRENCREVEARMDYPLLAERELSHKFLAYDRCESNGEAVVSTIYCRMIANSIFLVPQSGLRLCREVSDIATRRFPFQAPTLTNP